MSSDPLLQPYQLKHLRLRNRIVTTAHEPAYTEDGLPKDRYRAYHEERAKGGVAMVMTAGSASVSRDSPPAFGNVLAWKDEVVPWMARLADACHQHGAAVMIQLTHLGRRTRWDKGDWLPVLGAGPDREPAHRAFPKVIEDWDIERILGDYADACERMRAAGLDGVEFECYGHLPDQFLSPLTNDLPEPWGGPLGDRARFATEMLRRCRERVGPGFLLGMRFTADEAEAGGLTPGEGAAVATAWRDEGLVDFLNVIRGRIHTDAALTDVIPIQGMRSAPHLDLAGRLRARWGCPPSTRRAFPTWPPPAMPWQAGLVDLVGMTRAHIADPHVVQKIVEGREHDIRPCVGATYCLDRIYQGGEALCIHNPSTGRELSLPHVVEPAARARRVVVVGAGPGGLEAARVAALRGHHVTVLEAASQPGGQVRIAALQPRRREMLGIVDWRMAQCAARDVEFRFDTLAEAADVVALSPDLVVVATGGLADTAGLAEGDDLTVTAWDILTGDARPGSRVLVWDDAGDHAGLQAAQMLAESGSEVEIMTRDRTFAPEVMGMNLVPYMRALQPLGVRMTVAQRLLGVRRSGNALLAAIGTDYSAHRMEREFDQVVVNHGTRPLDDLYFDLKPLSRNRGAVDHEALAEGRPQPEGRHEGSFTLWRLGDAVAARNVHAAIHDALRLLRAA
jgi:2,4-dienoyl-CoA reductase-like NADH-dependent reductase (Old Yellow Enzyme family)/NADPH-dependent 2,4-dienoyl-CoA reductase/sulfur reductase-like enzyme